MKPKFDDNEDLGSADARWQALFLSNDADINGALTVRGAATLKAITGTTGSYSDLISALAGLAAGNLTGVGSLKIGESGTLTAAGGGSATLSYTNGLPARSVILAVVVRTVTTFTGASVGTFKIGDTGAAGRFRSTAVAGITADQVAVGLTHWDGTSEIAQVAAEDAVVTFYQADGATPASPTAGALRISVVYFQLTEAAGASYV